MHSIYQSITKLTEKQAHVNRAYFHERLSYPLCLHDRTTNWLQNKFQESSVTVQKSKKCKENYDEKEEIAFWICDKIVRKIPTHKTSSISIRKIAQKFVITPHPFFMML